MSGLFPSPSPLPRVRGRGLCYELNRTDGVRGHQKFGCGYAALYNRRAKIISLSPLGWVGDPLLADATLLNLVEQSFIADI